MGRIIGFGIFMLVFAMDGLKAATNSPDSLTTCCEAFQYETDDSAELNTICICLRNKVPVGYGAMLNMAVCDDQLCANVILKMRWDLAGNYVGFDTVVGKPLTKFDHKRFTDGDYKKLNEILGDRNSVLRVLAKADLVDKDVKLKSATVDAVSGATPATIKNAVVDGAVYSSYALWHLANGSIGDSIRAFTRRIYSEKIAFQLLSSDNFETQLFALKQFSPHDYVKYFERLTSVMLKSKPIVRAYIVNKAPLPFPDRENNLKFVSVIANLDGYSKSVFIDRIITEREMAMAFSTLVFSHLQMFDERQQNKFMTGIQKLGIQDLKKQIKDYLGNN